MAVAQRRRRVASLRVTEGNQDDAQMSDDNHAVSPAYKVAHDVDKETWENTLRKWKDSLDAAYQKLNVVKSILAARNVETHPLESVEVQQDVRKNVRAALFRARIGLEALRGDWAVVSVNEFEGLRRGQTTPDLFTGEKKASYLIHVTKEEFKGLRLRGGKAKPGYLFKLVKGPNGEEGAVKYGNVEAKGVYALIFRSEEKTIRVEVYAKEVKKWEEGRWTSADESQDQALRSLQKVSTPLGEMYRLASFKISTQPESKVPATPQLNIQGLCVDVDFFSYDGKHSKALLWGLGLTDLATSEWGVSTLGGPDIILHRLFYTASGGLSSALIHSIALTDLGPSVLFMTRAKANLPPKPMVWELLRDLAMGRAEDVKLRGDIKQLYERLRSTKSLDDALEVISEYFNVVEEVKVKARRGEKLYIISDDVDRVRPKNDKELKVVYVPRKLLFDLINALRNADFWLGLLIGDGTVDLGQDRLGLAVGERYIKAAKLLMWLFALKYGVGEGSEVKAEKGHVYFNAETTLTLITKLFNDLRQSGRLKELADHVKWWTSLGMPGGADLPKLLVLMALYERFGGKVENLTKSAFRLWLEYREDAFKKALNKASHVKVVADRAYIISFDEGEEGSEVVFLYPVAEGEKATWGVYRFKTDWNLYRLYCRSGCSELEKLAKSLDKNANEYEGYYQLSRAPGMALYYLLRRRYAHTLVLGGEVYVEGVGRVHKARVEVLEARENGDVKFRIWYHAWFKTRPHGPYVDVEIKHDEKHGGFRGWLKANEAEGVYSDHLGDLNNLLTGGLSATPVYDKNGRIEKLDFTGGFRRELLRRIGYRPETTPAAEPVAVRHLGGMRFEVEGLIVEFAETESKKIPLMTKLQFDTREEAELFYRRLLAAGVYAEVVGREVRLDDESYWGLVVASGVTPEGYQRIYPLPQDQYRDLYVFKRMAEDGVYYQFVVHHNGVWRTTGGWYGKRSITLWHSDRSVLEALKESARKAIGVELGEIGEKGSYYLYVTRPVLVAFDERWLASMPVERPEIAVAGNSIIIRLGGVEHKVGFELRKAKEYVSLPDQRLYPALKAIGVEAELDPEGVVLRKDVMWGLLAAVVEETLKRGEKLAPPQGVSLIATRLEDGHYVFRVETEDGQYICSVLKLDGQWTAMCGKIGRRSVQLTHSKEKVARAHADAFNKLLKKCIKTGKCSRKEPKPMSGGKAWYFYLYQSDLGLLYGGHSWATTL